MSEPNPRRQNAMRALFRAFSPSTPGVGARFAALPRMIKAIAKREYDGGWRLLGMLGALAYIVSPIDLLPEAIFLAIGLVDDAAVLAWLVGSFASETERFLEWERLHGRGPKTVTGQLTDK